MGLAEFHRRGPDTYSVPDNGAFVVDREVLPLADFADGLPATSGFIGQAGHTWLLGGGFYTHRSYAVVITCTRLAVRRWTVCSGP